jgi:two-component system, OmpR family, response regulator ChvI
MVNTEPDVIVSTSSGNTSSQTAIKDSSSSYRILIVDDEQDVALGYESILKGAGFNVDVYNDPLIALSKLKEIYSSSFHDTLSPSQTSAATATPTKQDSIKPYDLLLLDIRMPVMNGFELYRETKKIMKNEEDNPKVCFITAYELYYDQLKEEFPMIDVGCFIKKPVNASDLLKRIKQELLLE